MSSREYDLPGYSRIVGDDSQRYLVQGELEHQLTMERPLDALFEFERDNIQEMLGEVQSNE